LLRRNNGRKSRAAARKSFLKKNCAQNSKKENLSALNWGVDPTAPDLHLGHLVALRKLKTFQDLGHHIEFLIGDFTAQIGDPSGRNDARPPLNAQQVWAPAKTYQEQVFKVLDPEKTNIQFNSKWLNPLGIQGHYNLLRRTSVAQMLKRADFAKRFEADEHLSMLEMVYPVLQGYDSVALQADLELGGTDQKLIY